MHREVKWLPFKVIWKDGRFFVRVTENGKKKYFSAEQLFAMILLKIKEDAEQQLGNKIKYVTKN